MKLSILPLLAILLLSPTLALSVANAEEPAESMERLVSLVDGAIYRGEVLEYVPKSHVTLRLIDGEVRRFNWSQVRRVTMVASIAANLPPSAPIEHRQVAAPLPSPPPPPAEKPVQQPTARPAPLTAAPPSPPPPKPQVEKPLQQAPDRPAPLPIKMATPVKPELQSYYQAHFRRAKELFDADDLEASVPEFEAAYSAIPDPINLYFLAMSYHRLHKFAVAAHFYTRYLAADPTISETRRADVTRYISDVKIRMSDPSAELSPAPEQRQDELGQPQVPKGGEPNMGMVAAGTVILATSYFVAGLAGTIALATHDEQSPSSSLVTGTLLVPVLGPFISAAATPSAGWSLPWVFLGGGTQVLGLALTIAGTRKQPVRKNKVAVLPVLSPYGSGLTMAGRF